MEKKTLRAQACKFRRYYNRVEKIPSDWEPGIAFLPAFGVSDVTFIVDADGNKVKKSYLYTYDLLQLRVDRYINIEPHDYAGKTYSPKE